MTIARGFSVAPSRKNMSQDAKSPPSWSDAPPGWNWLAQDADGRWFWYAVEPQLGLAGGVWRSPRRAQQFAGQGKPSAIWYESCSQRPEFDPAGPSQE